MTDPNPELALADKPWPWPIAIVLLVVLVPLCLATALFEVLARIDWRKPDGKANDGR